MINGAVTRITGLGVSLPLKRWIWVLGIDAYSRVQYCWSEGHINVER